MTKKVVVLGSAGAGKSTLIQSYNQGQFSPQFASSIGLNSIKFFTENNNPVEVPGQEKNFNFDENTIKNYDFAVIVYDPSMDNFADDVSFWLSKIENSNINYIFILCNDKEGKVDKQEKAKQELGDILNNNNIGFLYLNKKEDEYWIGQLNMIMKEGILKKIDNYITKVSNKQDESSCWKIFSAVVLIAIIGGIILYKKKK